MTVESHYIRYASYYASNLGKGRAGLYHNLRIYKSLDEQCSGQEKVLDIDVTNMNNMFKQANKYITKKQKELLHTHAQIREPVTIDPDAEIVYAYLM